MKASTIAVFATFGSAGSSKSNYHGFADSCSDIDLIYGNNTLGGGAILRGRCKIPDSLEPAFSELNLNNCFGWSEDACGFIGPPGGSNFTDRCWHPEWNGHTLSYLCGCPHALLKFVIPIHDYIGNDRGQLVC